MATQYTVPTASTNVCAGKSVKDSAGTPAANAIVDNNTSAGNYTHIAGASYVTVDLGGLYALDTVKTWHYYTDGRTISNARVDISHDGLNWTTVFNASVDGTYAETSAGKEHTFTPQLVRYVRDYGSLWVEVQAFNKSQVDPGGFVELESYLDVVQRDAPVHFWSLVASADYGSSTDQLPPATQFSKVGDGELTLEPVKPKILDGFEKHTLDFTGAVAVDAWLGIGNVFANRETTVFEVGVNRVYFNVDGWLTVNSVSSSTINLSNCFDLGKYILWQVEGAETVLYFDNVKQVDLTVSGDLLSAETVLKIGTRDNQNHLMMSLLGCYPAALDTQSRADRMAFSKVEVMSFVPYSKFSAQVLKYGRKDAPVYNVGYLTRVYVSGYGDYNEGFDPGVKPTPYAFEDTIDIGLFEYRQDSVLEQDDTGILPTKVTPFRADWVFTLAAYNSYKSSDIVSMDLEFLNASGGVVAAIRIYGTSGSHSLKYGTSLSSLTTAAQSGTAITTGDLTFTEDKITFTNTRTSSYNDSWYMYADVNSIVEMRFSNCRVRKYDKTSMVYFYLYIQEGGSILNLSDLDFFKGDFRTVPKASIDAAFTIPTTYTVDPTNGFTNTDSVPVSLFVRGVDQGQRAHFKPHYGKLEAGTECWCELSADGLELTICEYGTVRQINLPQVESSLHFTHFIGTHTSIFSTVNGNLAVMANGSEMYGELVPCVVVQPGQSVGRIEVGVGVDRPYPEASPSNVTVNAVTLKDIVWGNEFSYEQTNPNIAELHYFAPKCSDWALLSRGDNAGLIKPGGGQYELGYIANKVTINGIPADDRRVLCYLQSGDLVDETRTDLSGNYRFDLLYTDRRYMIVAQDKPEHGNAEYNAVAADFQLPTPYN